MKRPFVGLALVCALLVPAAAHAQEKGKVGITMGYPASVGLLWHVADNVALRPEFDFAHSNRDSEISESSTDTVGLGVSLLLYMKKWDNTAAYFVPRFAWSHASAKSESDFGGSNFESKSTGDAYTYSGSFGAQGWLGSRFSAYGEVGLAYTTASSESELSGSENKTTGFGLRSGVGIVFYF